MEGTIDATRHREFSRLQVVAMYLAYPVGAGVAIAATGPGRPGGVTAFVVGAALMTLSYALLLRLATTRFWRPGNVAASLLDERERMLRDRAYRRAYAVAATLPLLGMIYSALALDKGLWLPTGFEQANIVFWGLFLFVVSLPSAALAWEGEAV